MAESGASAAWLTSCPANGRQVTAPMRQPKVVTWSAEACFSAGFCTIVAIAQVTAATTQSATPRIEAPPPSDIGEPDDHGPGERDRHADEQPAREPSLRNRPDSRPR